MDSGYNTWSPLQRWQGMGISLDPLVARGFTDNPLKG